MKRRDMILGGAGAMLALPAAASEGVMRRAGRSVGRAAKRTGDAIERGAQRTGTALERAAGWTGRQLRRAREWVFGD